MSTLLELAQLVTTNFLISSARQIILLMMTYLSFAWCTAFADEPTYTKATSLPPLRITYPELQKILDKSATLMSLADNSTSNLILTEKLRLKHGDSQVEIQGHQLQGSNVKLPKITTELDYRMSTRFLAAAPITTVSLLFDDYRRNLTVEGQSQEQVDALFTSLKSDFQDLSTFGGSNFRTLAGPIIFSMCILTILMFSLNWIGTRRTRLLVPVLFGLIGLVLLFVLPFDDFLAGFSASDFDPSFSSRYASELTVTGMIIALIGIPLSYYLPIWFGHGASPSTSQSSTATPPNHQSRPVSRRRHRATRGR